MESLTDDQRALFADGGQLDDYEVLKPIGKGKFSVVYKAIRRHDNQAVALKKIAIFDMMNLKAREKTLKEVRLVQSVRHPNIIQYLDAFVENNELCIAFEWAEAGDLKRQIRKANEKGPSSSDKQQGTPSNSRPPSAQGDIDNGDDEELGGMIVDDQAITCQEVTQIQAIRHKQANQLEGYEKQLNDRFLRAHRLYDESTTRLAKARDEISIIQSEPFLTFESVQLDTSSKCATFQFHFCGGRRFHATMRLKGLLETLREDDMTSPAVRNALLHIGLCILPWFWMGYNCKHIRIQAGYLNPEQVHFWEEFYQNVLSEYLYLHGLDRDRLYIQVEAPEDDAFSVLSDRRLEQQGKTKVLVPLGGGKDSLVVYQLLSSSDTPCAWLHVGDQPQEFERSWRFREILEMTQERTVATAFRFEHDMDSKTWQSEVGGTRYQPAGHPWAALVAFDSVLTAILGDFTHVAVGNERSANFGNNVMHEGRPVNHQYDKSFAFEMRAHAYIRKYLVQDLHYFSALQHLWEVQIARSFASRSLACPTGRENFLRVFLSCNEAPDGDKWCCECAKCAFVFILMSAWCSTAQLEEIFGENLFEKSSIFPEFLSLLDDEGVKPMECVGTSSETWLSLYLALRAHGDTTFLKSHEQAIRCKGAALMHLLDDYNDDHLLPPFLESTLRQPIRALAV
ncbi:hypothetical protein PHYBOEH_009147 [Phytophthora boehmeriae]|uniref:NEK6-subfamily protein kinase n=1 Tax=Phytophthora boehmeriae TaxID=109152 RepID=A0A8T1X0H7_9STRA|nr:hypothetical protein PHYBOEH_009147 [Phytophthora boehmeriae]